MRSGKKVGGVKQRGGSPSPAVAVPTAKPGKKIGGVKVVRGFGTSRQMESCPENCPGEYVEGGYWIHSRTCPWAAVLWNAHGYTVKDWRCPYDCDPVQLSAGWTHDYRCPFWERTGRTPFDHNAPKNAQQVKHGKEKGNRNQPRGKQYDFSKFPDALRESRDNLPF